MATMKDTVVLKYQTTKDGEIEETEFSAGSDVTIVQTWKNHYLIKDNDGHYFNVAKSHLAS